ncbi:hypothetical protein N24_2946 [Corynebacterium suranareeae]|uniref:Htaa domain-containing protein n=1 Tax=Corynebacterium suranareeae TaxID=2506452 RepID=A0A169S6H3_9CORY|nr:HtaA domain-containing protein [Corynebacterium suranareeae]BAU97208.1 hypothetical protein N24_2946 [Corynebacterium suranareeae]
MSQKFSRRAIAALTAAAISTSAFTAVAPAALAAPIAAVATTDDVAVVTAENSLDWGFKASWRNYVTGPWTAGTVDATEGATVNEDGTYNFTLGSGSTYDADSEQGQLNYEGTVRFASALHGFDITLANPQIIVDGATATLTAELSDSAAPEDTATSRVEVAEFSLAAPEVVETKTAFSYTWTEATGTFLETLQPAELSRYAGQETDALSFSITVDKEKEVVTGSSPSFLTSILNFLQQLASPLLKLFGSLSS